MLDDSDKMARSVIVSLDGGIFPDVDPVRPPQDLSGWEQHYCHGDKGALRLRDLLRRLAKLGHEAAKRQQLLAHFAGVGSPISEHQIEKLLYGKKPPRLGFRRLRLIIRYLWDAGLLPRGPYAAQAPADPVRALHDGLTGFLQISERALAELGERLPGRYWIHRPSVREPGAYVKGLLTVDVRKPGRVLIVTERYRAGGDAGQGGYGFDEVHDGLILEKAHRPFLLSCRRLPAPEAGMAGEQPGLAAFGMTVIADLEMDPQGRVASMTGFTSSSCVTRGFVAAPVCFDRIPDSQCHDPEGELGTLPRELLPRSVRGRLGSFVDAHGLIRL